MIVSKRKPVEEVLDMLKGRQAGRDLRLPRMCAGRKVGGDDEVAEWKQLLESKGYVVTGTAMPTESCLNFHVRRPRRELQKGQPEAVLSLACGSGVQTAAQR